jgi:hypothetical protein
VEDLAFRVIAADERRDRAGYAFMRRVLDTDLGRSLHRKRKTMIEPIFGDAEYNRNVDGFPRRGRPAVVRNGGRSRHAQTA